MTVTDGLLRWAQRPGAAAALDAARGKVESGRRGDSVTLAVELNPTARDDVSRLLGGPWLTSGKPVTLGQLRRATRREGCELEQLLVATGGPLRDLPAEREHARAASMQQHADATQELCTAGIPEEAASSLVPRPVTPELAGSVAAVWSTLPDPGQRAGLARLAVAVTSDAHALDRDQPLGRVLTRVLAAVHDLGEIQTAAQWREAWACAGIDCDAVSATVLVVGVALDGEGPAALLSRATPGEPVWLTARALASGGWAWARGLTVRVCENPSVVEEAATRFGQACPPLVCTYGLPSSAAWLLLRDLANRARVLATGDRDPTGRLITERVLAFTGGSEWLPHVPGMFEEERLEELMADLAGG